MTTSSRLPRRASLGAAVRVMVVVGLTATGCAGGSSDNESAPGTPSGSPTGTTATRTTGVPTTDAPTDTTPPRPGAPCLQPSDHARLVRFGPRQGLGGYAVGTGARYVVLAHQSDGDSCQMLPLALRLAAAGYHAFAFDGAGVESSTAVVGDGRRVADDVLSAVAWCRARGAESVALVGASKGGYGVLSAALLARRPVDAVVSLSAPSVWDDPQGKPLDIAAMASPTQLWASRYDTTFFEAAKGFARDDPAAELHIAPGIAHGVQLVSPAFGRIRGFLDAHLR
ncbi:MAG: alpha/beta fold hydrolase [Nocardioidaceae bacterium]